MNDHSNISSNALALPTSVGELTAGVLEAAFNPQPRVPVCVLIDTSESLVGPPAAELESALHQFLEEVRGDITCQQSVELAFITFGETVSLALPFRPLLDIDARHVPELAPAGCTPMGEAIHLALDTIRDRRRHYSEVGLAGYVPWVVLLTDGEATDDVEDAVARLRAKTSTDEVVLFIVAIGDGANMPFLTSIAQVGRPPKRLRGLCFKEFFRWLSDSLRVVSSSTPRQRPQLPSTERWSL